ncbi:MAG TPA: hypothetical protein PKL55_09410, partial [Syntrophales bacterium]|nr:hypothetical protein [Syntrophales bacterium]
SHFFLLSDLFIFYFRCLPYLLLFALLDCNCRATMPHTLHVTNYTYLFADRPRSVRLVAAVKKKLANNYPPMLSKRLKSIRSTTAAGKEWRRHPR